MMPHLGVVIQIPALETLHRVFSISTEIKQADFSNNSSPHSNVAVEPWLASQSHQRVEALLFNIEPSIFVQFQVCKRIFFSAQRSKFIPPSLVVVEISGKRKIKFMNIIVHESELSSRTPLSESARQECTAPTLTPLSNARWRILHKMVW
jgi:hypothetical protein